MLELALGRMGMNHEEFWDITPRDFFYKYKGWQKQRNEADRAEWERARMISIYAANAGRYKDKITAKKIPFAWDQEVKPKHTLKSKAEIQAFINECRKKHGKTADFKEVKTDGIS